ncbi:PAS domain-containing protein (plasmid) [Rhizobium sp. RCAM05350]|nr:PAS domain-containing protein [Rhizobium sp. RCAM05350]
MELLRPHAEVVIHDIVTGRIAYIANAFSKRVIGDPSLLDDDPELAQVGLILGPYEKEHVDGRSLRSITTVIKDFDDRSIGYLCVNLDLTPFDGVRKAVETLLQFNQAAVQPASLFAKDWREKINGVTAHFLREQSCTLSALTKSDRIELVAIIEQAGLFEARGAAEYVARQLEVSRAALYRYLAEARST